MQHTVLHHRDGQAILEPIGPGRTRVTGRPTDTSIRARETTCETSYPPELVERLLQVKGPAWLCDEILRDEDPGYVRRQLEYGILPYVAAEELEGRRLLDFGCGSGASTAVLARMFPRTEIVGVELEEELLSIARLRARHYGLSDVAFYRSPDGTDLPDDLGTFDYVCMSAVFEHLLPAERLSVLPLLWGVLRPGGVLFVLETPHRWNPVESHTTGLPLNYLPRRLAHRLALRYSDRIDRNSSWEQLLRNGIRGATPGEVLRAIGHEAPAAMLMRPTQMELGDEVDLWYAKAGGGTSPRRRAVRAALKAANRFGLEGFVPYLYIAIRKSPSSAA